MRKSAYIVIVAAVALVAFVSGNAQAQSAKFAANWSKEFVRVGVETDIEGSTCYGEDNLVPFTPIGDGTESLPCNYAKVLLATIDMAQQKDLLIGVSAQVGLVTYTLAKKAIDATIGEALASAKMTVTLLLRDKDTGLVVQKAAPGPVVFAARLQELKVSSTDLINEISVSLLLKTTAAHHFNFLGIDLDQGVYDVEAVFDLNAFASVVGVDSLAKAEVILGPRMVTLQEVRAVKDSLDPLPIPVP